MQESKRDGDKLYFFSAVFGAAQHVFNVEFSEQILHLYVVANWTHGQLNGRLVAESAQAPMTPVMPDGTLSNLGEVVGALANRLESDKPFDDLLSEMCRLGYSATGNGFYLMQVGKL
jgi:hypothetical protein